MNIQLDFSDSLSSRLLSQSKFGTGQLIKIQNPENQRAKDQGTASIEIAQLPMTRKGGPLALVFDRMDSNANGVLTRAELISYRLKPMVTEMTIPASQAMAEESIRNAARAAEANISEQAENAESDEAPKLIGQSDPASPALPKILKLPEFAPTLTGEPAAPAALPQSMPESVVMAQTSAPAEAVPA